MAATRVVPRVSSIETRPFEEGAGFVCCGVDADASPPGPLSDEAERGRFGHRELPGMTMDKRNKESSDGRNHWKIDSQLRRRMMLVARELRERGTEGEQVLWEQLRAKRFRGLKFRRQQPVGPFVLDFYCSQQRLAVEVDGEIHRQQTSIDADRQQLIESLHPLRADSRRGGSIQCVDGIATDRVGD